MRRKRTVDRIHHVRYFNKLLEDRDRGRNNLVAAPGVGGRRELGRWGDAGSRDQRSGVLLNILQLIGLPPTQKKINLAPNINSTRSKSSALGWRSLQEAYGQESSQFGTKNSKQIWSLAHCTTESQSKARYQR